MNRQLHRPDDPSQVIIRGCGLLEIPIQPQALAAMDRYIELVLQWRKRARLTSLNDPIEIAIFHFLDSLAVFKVLPLHSGYHVLDLGTGAGFPGIVMRIADPSLEIALMDRDPRKIVFLKYVVKQLGIQGVRFLNIRLQDMLANPRGNNFHGIVSRAFSSDPNLMDSLSSLLYPGGSLIRMAGPASLGENFALKNFIPTALWEGVLPFSNRFRRVLRYTVRSHTNSHSRKRHY